MFRKILALYDLSPAGKHALEVAVSLAARCRASLEVAHVIFQSERVQAADPALLSRELIRHLEGEIQNDLKKISKAKRASGLNPLKITVTDGQTVPALLALIDSAAPDLVVMGAHGRTGLKHVLLGSVAEKILRYSPFPVWVVRKARLPLKRILVPVELADSAEEALGHAENLKKIYPPLKVDLLHVVQFADLVGYYPESFAGHALVELKALREAAKAGLATMAATHPDLKAKAQIRIGQAAAEIEKAAKSSKAGLILLSTHGRSGLRHLLMGSVAEQVIRYAPCSVLSLCPRELVERRREAIRKIQME